MLREISEEVRVNLKDRLREVRHSIRRHRHQTAAGRSRMQTGTHPSFPLREIEGLLGHAASAFDDVMTIAEKFAPASIAKRASPLPKPLGAYFTARDPLSGERAFRRDAYAMTQAVLLARQLEGAHVSEARFAAVYAAFARQHAGSIEKLETTEGRTERTGLVAELCSSLLVDFVRHEPLHFDAAPAAGPKAETAGQTAVLSCLAPVALACGLATLESADAQSETLEIAALAIEARIDRIVEAFAARDTEAELTPLFAMLLTHIA